MVEIKSFVPSTGRGAFDISYTPGTLILTVKVNAIYENRKIEKVQWSEEDKHKFERSAHAAVQENWNGKFRFINRNRNPAEIVLPFFLVKFVPGNEATVLMRVPRYASAYGMGNLARCDSYVGLEQLNTGDPTAQSTAMVHSESTTPVNVQITEASNISRDERKRIEDIIDALAIGGIGQGGAITPQVIVALANLATRMKLGAPSRPLVPIIVTGICPQMRGPVRDALQRNAEAIKVKLMSFNIVNPIVVAARMGVSTQNAGHITIAPDKDFEHAFNEPMSMNIFAHEFGHMLGLPDEYDAAPQPNSTVPKDVAINRFLAMSKDFGTTNPEMGRMTTSIMCKGTDLLPCHMVTALQALQVATRDPHWRVF